jgi:hypothetical protein
MSCGLSGVNRKSGVVTATYFSKINQLCGAARQQVVVPGESFASALPMPQSAF